MKIQKIITLCTLTLCLLSSCSQDDDTIALNNITKDYVRSLNDITTTSKYGLIGDVKQVETFYYQDAVWNSYYNKLNKKEFNIKEIKNFDENGAIIKYQHIYSSFFYDEDNIIQEKAWQYDNKYRITQYTNLSVDSIEGKPHYYYAHKYTFDYNDTEKKVTQIQYLGDDKGVYTRLKTTQYSLNDKGRIDYPDLDKEINQKVAPEKGNIDLEQYENILKKDKKGNIIMSYYKKESPDSSIEYPMYDIQNYYEQAIIYYDGTISFYKEDIVE